MLQQNHFSWKDIGCLDSNISNHAIAPICQHDIGYKDSRTKTLYGCPFEWTEYEGRCYRHFLEETNWMTAEKHCRDYDASLVSIHSSRENDFLFSFSGGTSFWIGAFYSGSEDLFWSDFSENNFTNLYSLDTGCLYQYSSYGWTGTNCYSSHAELTFICKKFNKV